MIQLYHHYTKWEDYTAGMWRKVPKDEAARFLEDAIIFTSNHELYGKAMLRVIEEWPIACEQNLTDKSQNRQAWIGHAASCLEFNCPEYITRQAWAFLSRKQQNLANAAADFAIAKWESMHA